MRKIGKTEDVPKGGVDVNQLIRTLHSDGYLDAERYIKMLQGRLAVYERQTIVEYCAECESEIEMCWNIKENGYRAFCPVCGSRLMLCDMCQHDEESDEYCGDCDYCSATDSCKHNPARLMEREGA